MSRPRWSSPRVRCLGSGDSGRSGTTRLLVRARVCRGRLAAVGPSWVPPHAAICRSLQRRERNYPSLLGFSDSS
jgi:hypothetical protein